MAFTYDFTNAANLSMVRMLVGDTVEANHIWEDAEVNAALQMESSQGILMAFSGYSRTSSQVYSPRRAAATLLDGLASNRARLVGSLKVLDIEIGAGSVAGGLRDMAEGLREAEENSGDFGIAEMTVTPEAARDRFWNQAARQAF